MKKEQWKNEVKNQLNNLMVAFDNLAELFEDSEEMGEIDTISEDFPFSKSFEDVNALVSMWGDNLIEKLERKEQ